MHPILVQIGPLTIHSFGLMVMIGFLVGGSYVVAHARAAGIDRDRAWTMNLLVLAAILVGGRVMYVVVELFRSDELRRHPLEVFAVWHGGLAFYGGLALTFVVVVWYARRHAMPVLELCDLYAAAGFLGESFGRIGCFLAGDDYGKPAPHLWWAVRFTDPASEVPPPLRGIPLHPTQLYLWALAFGIFVVTDALARRKRLAGEPAAAALMLYAVGRSLIELVRGDADRGFVLHHPVEVSTSQFLSPFCALLAVALWSWGRRQAALHRSRSRANG